MSHSRIFQFSDKEIKKEDYLNEDIFSRDDSLWDAFRSTFCGDFVEDRSEEERLKDIQWLAESLNFLDITLKDKDVFVLEKDFKEKLSNFWYSRIQNAFDAIEKKDIGAYIPRTQLKYACIDPLSMGFGFLFYSKDTELSHSNEFFEWLLSRDPGDLIYIGATLNYHC